MMRSIISLCMCITLLLPIPLHASSVDSSLASLFKSYSFLNANKQSLCVIDENGKALFGHNEIKRVVPASVSKVYLMDFILNELPADYRFITEFHLTGNTLYIKGSSDPFFLDSHLKMVLSNIQKDFPSLKIKKIIYYDFFLNWSTSTWKTTQEIRTSVKAVPNVSSAVLVTYSSKPLKAGNRTYTFTSDILIKWLKQVQMYSTNSASDILFTKLGGPIRFREYMKDMYGVDSKEIEFMTGSGLEKNYTTCALSVRVLRHLDQKMISLGYSLSDIMAVPQIDEGPMKNRLQTLHNPKLTLVKPGYLYNHDTLVGALLTKQNKKIYYGVFTEYNNRSDGRLARLFIDTWVSKLVLQYKTIPFGYTKKLFDYNNGATVFRKK